MSLSAHSVYVLSASARREHAWYRVERDGAVTRLDDADDPAATVPPGWDLVKSWVRPGRPSLILFRLHGARAALVSGVPSRRRRMGSALKDTFLVLEDEPGRPWVSGLAAGLLSCSPAWDAEPELLRSLTEAVLDPERGSERDISVNTESLEAALDDIAGQANTIAETARTLPEGVWLDSEPARRQLAHALKTAGDGGRGVEVVAAVVSDLPPERLTAARWALTSHTRAPRAEERAERDQLDLATTAGAGAARSARIEAPKGPAPAKRQQGLVDAVRDLLAWLASAARRRLKR